MLGFLADYLLAGPTRAAIFARGVVPSLTALLSVIGGYSFAVGVSHVAEGRRVPLALLEVAPIAGSYFVWDIAWQAWGINQGRGDWLSPFVIYVMLLGYSPLVWVGAGMLSLDPVRRLGCFTLGLLPAAWVCLIFASQGEALVGLTWLAAMWSVAPVSISTKATFRRVAVQSKYALDTP